MSWRSSEEACVEQSEEGERQGGGEDREGMGQELCSLVGGGVDLGFYPQGGGEEGCGRRRDGI